MASGYVWPTYLFDATGVGTPECVEDAASLFDPLLDEIPEILSCLGTTLGEGYKIGGYVRPERIAELARHLRDVEPAILTWAEEDGWRDECAEDLRKLREAVDHAERRGLGFVEVSGLYSAAFGLYN
jgi:hypothetical protein